jgi:hypothetical protein
LPQAPALGEDLPQDATLQKQGKTLLSSHREGLVPTRTRCQWASATACPAIASSQVGRLGIKLRKSSRCRPCVSIALRVSSFPPTSTARRHCPSASCPRRKGWTAVSTSLPLFPETHAMVSRPSSLHLTGAQIRLF